MKTYGYGFPRLGKDREFKKSIEAFWGGQCSQEDVFQVLESIQDDTIQKYRQKIEIFPDGEMSLYDPMLDTAVLCGVFHPKDLNEYYDLCRGASALEMTKWFNTNYHYLVTDFSDVAQPSFKCNKENFIYTLKKCNFPQFVGPFTFLKLSKGIGQDRFKEFFLSLMDVYKEMICGYDRVQLDEPAFVLDLESWEVDVIKEGYRKLAEAEAEITVMTYYDSVDWMDEFLSLPVSAFGLDFVHGTGNQTFIKNESFPDDKILIAGVVDGRNIWKNDIERTISLLNILSLKSKKLVISNAGPLYHLPVSLEGESFMDVRLKERLSFAEEKIGEIALIADYFNGKRDVEAEEKEVFGIDENVRKRVNTLDDASFCKPVSLQEREALQKDILNLPLFPTTTIGSFPQTAEVRRMRAAFRKGDVSADEYTAYIRQEIDKLIAFQEVLGLDVFVHGEFERTDMVEFFAQKLSGIATTQAGWIISYGTRTYRPPVIFGDVSRPQAMTVDEIVYAQSKTDKPVKGMLTGAVTIIAWSFCREDIPVSEVAYQISLSLRDEIKDYEKAGIKIVQVDEAAFREKAPLKKQAWPEYFDWAVKSFNLATNTDPRTQIHTHMCYSEFGEIMSYINEMDFDVISIEVARSRGDLIKIFSDMNFQKQIGLGVWDIHSPVVPPVSEMLHVVERSLQYIAKEKFWLNPDCGLKTRDWPETKKALVNLVKTAKQLR